MDKKGKSKVYCSVYGCKSFYGSPGVHSMHFFPPKGKKKVEIVNKVGAKEMIDRQMAWIKTLKMGKKVSKTMPVCSLHFSNINYRPQVPGKVYKKRYLKDDAVPDQFLPKTPEHGSEQQKIAKTRCKRKLFVKRNEEDEPKSRMLDVSEPKNSCEPKSETHDEVSVQEVPEESPKKIGRCSEGIQASTEMFTKETQTLGNRYVRKILQEEPETKVIRRFMSYELVDDKEFEFFSGITKTLLNGLLDLLGRDLCMRLKYFDTKKDNTTSKKILKVLSVEDQLFMTLARLRRGFSEQELAYFFAVSQPTVSRILTTWFQFLYLEFKKYSKVMFHCINEDYDIPHCFNNKFFKNLPVIIDCTELFTEQPGDFRQQGNTYSSYKSTNTVKFLVGINVQGGINFVSDGFEGCISDREIVIDSGFLEFLNSGKTVLADRGFTIRDILDPLGVKLIIPPFLDGRDALTPSEELITKFIARARIHVERTMHLIKSFVFFKLPVKVSLSNDIANVFCGLFFGKLPKTLCALMHEIPR